jgi:hypothetical protein
MKTRTIATLTALTLTAFAGTSARAGDAAVTLAQPGEDIEIIVVTAKRPATLISDDAYTTETAAVAATPAPAATGAVTMAWQEPGFVEEVIVVTASRGEALAAMREVARVRWMERAAQGPQYGSWKNWAGMPAR